MLKIIKSVGLILSLGLSGLALTPAGAQDCCAALRSRCANSICRDKGGIAEFSCNPDTCQAVCLCHVFP